MLHTDKLDTASHAHPQVQAVYIPYVCVFVCASQLTLANKLAWRESSSWSTVSDMCCTTAGAASSPGSPLQNLDSIGQAVCAAVDAAMHEAISDALCAAMCDASFKAVWTAVYEAGCVAACVVVCTAVCERVSHSSQVT